MPDYEGGRVITRLKTDSSQWKPGIDSAKNQLNELGGSIENVAGKFSTSSAAIHASVLAASAGMVKFGNDAFNAMNAFQEGMANVESLIPGNTARINELTRAVERLQIELGKSGHDLSKGLYQVISAYGDNADTLASLELNAKSAAAGVATTADAINLTSAVTKAYGDTSMTAQQKASDLALLTVRLGQTTFPELAESIGKVTPLTKQLGISQEELFASMATLTGVTGKAAEVSTQFRGALQAIMAPTAEMQNLMDSLGYANGEAMVKQLGLSGSIRVVTEAARQSGKPLQDYIESIEGQVFALALSGAQAKDYAEKLEKIKDSAGTTEEAYKAQTEGVNKLGHSWKTAQQVWQVFLQHVGAVAPLIIAAGSITGIVEGVNLLRMGLIAIFPKKVADTTATIADTVAVEANTGAIALNTRARIANMGKAVGGNVVSGLTTVGGGVASGLTAIGGTVGMASVAGGALAAGLYAVAAAGIAAVGYELWGIYKYSKDAKEGMAEYNRELAKNKPIIDGIIATARKHQQEILDAGYSSRADFDAAVKAGDKKAISLSEKFGYSKEVDEARFKLGLLNAEQQRAADQAATALATAQKYGEISLDLAKQIGAERIRQIGMSQEESALSVAYLSHRKAVLDNEKQLAALKNKYDADVANEVVTAKKEKRAPNLALLSNQYEQAKSELQSAASIERAEYFAQRRYIQAKADYDLKMQQTHEAEKLAITELEGVLSVHAIENQIKELKAQEAREGGVVAKARIEASLAVLAIEKENADILAKFNAEKEKYINESGLNSEMRTTRTNEVELERKQLLSKLGDKVLEVKIQGDDRVFGIEHQRAIDVAILNADNAGIKLKTEEMATAGHIETMRQTLARTFDEVGKTRLASEIESAQLAQDNASALAWLESEYNQDIAKEKDELRRDELTRAYTENVNLVQRNYNAWKESEDRKLAESLYNLNKRYAIEDALANAQQTARGALLSKQNSLAGLYSSIIGATPPSMTAALAMAQAEEDKKNALKALQDQFDRGQGVFQYGKDESLLRKLQDGINATFSANEFGIKAKFAQDSVEAMKKQLSDAFTMDMMFDNADFQAGVQYALAGRGQITDAVANMIGMPSLNNIAFNTFQIPGINSQFSPGQMALGPIDLNLTIGYDQNGFVALMNGVADNRIRVNVQQGARDARGGLPVGMPWER